MNNEVNVISILTDENVEVMVRIPDEYTHDFGVCLNDVFVENNIQTTCLALYSHDVCLDVKYLDMAIMKLLDMHCNLAYVYGRNGYSVYDGSDTTETETVETNAAESEIKSQYNLNEIVNQSRYYDAQKNNTCEYLPLINKVSNGLRVTVDVHNSIYEEYFFSDELNDNVLPKTKVWDDIKRIRNLSVMYGIPCNFECKVILDFSNNLMVLHTIIKDPSSLEVFASIVNRASIVNGEYNFKDLYDMFQWVLDISEVLANRIGSRVDVCWKHENNEIERYEFPVNLDI